MDLLAAAKMRATATVTLFVTFLIAVGCSAAEVDGVSQLELKIKIKNIIFEKRNGDELLRREELLRKTIEEILEHTQDDKQEAIDDLGKYFGQDLCYFRDHWEEAQATAQATGLAPGGVAAGVGTAAAKRVLETTAAATAAAAAAATTTENTSLAFEELKGIKACGVIAIPSLEKKIGKQFAIIGKVVDEVVDDSVGNIGIRRGSKNDVRIIINGADNTVDIDRYVVIIATVGKDCAVAVNEVVSTRTFELERPSSAFPLPSSSFASASYAVLVMSAFKEARKSLLEDVRESFKEAMLKANLKAKLTLGPIEPKQALGLQIGQVIVEERVKKIMEALDKQLLNFNQKKEDTLKASSARAPGSSWIPAEFLGLTIFLAAAIAVIFGICRKTNIGSRKILFSREMK